MYVLLTTGYFDRRVVKFTRAHPELKKPLAKVLGNLEANPFLPSLRLHPLSGELEGLHAVSVTHAHRITLTLRVTKRKLSCSTSEATTKCIDSLTATCREMGPGNYSFPFSNFHVLQKTAEVWIGIETEGISNDPF